MFRPFLSLYLLMLGADVTQVGIFFTADLAFSALLRPIGGWISDNLGRIPSVAIGSVIGLFSYVAFTLAPSWQWMVAFSFTFSAGRALVGPSFRAYTAESAPEGQTAETFGLVNGLFTICGIIGPVLGGWLVTAYGIRTMFWGAVGVMVIATGLRMYAARGESFRWERVQLSGLGGSMRGMFAMMFAGGAITWLVLSDGVADFGTSTYAELRPILFEQNGLTEANIGLLFSFHAMVYMLVSLFGSRLADRWSAVGALVFGRGIHVFSLGLLAFFPTPTMFWVYIALDALSFGLGDPAFDAMLANAAPKGNMGMTFGIFSTTISVFSMPAPYIGGLLWENVGTATPFLLGAAALGVAIVMLLVVLRPLMKASRSPT